MRGRGAAVAAPAVVGPGVFHSGLYYSAGYAPTLSTGAPANAQLIAEGAFFGRALTVATVGVEITAAGTAGALIRLGIYADDGTGYPGALVLDAGTIDGTQVAGGYELAANVVIGPGQVWFAFANQGAPVTTTAVRLTASPSPGYGAATIAGATNNTGLARVSITGGAAGALPNTFPAGAVFTSSGVRVVFKVA